MRSVTTAQAEALESLHALTRTFVEVDDGSGGWVDLTAYLGVAWVRSLQVDESEESTVSRARLELFREADGDSLGPLTTPEPLIRHGRVVRIGTETRLAADGPATGRLDIIHGRIARMEWGGDASRLVVDIRDLIGADLRDTMIRTPMELPAGRLEDLVALILDTHVPHLPDLVVEGSPDFVFPAPSVIRQQSVEAAISSLVDQSGWIIQRRWVGFGWRLVLREPPDPSEDPPPPDAVLAPHHYRELPSAGSDSANVRDEIIIIYRDGAGTTESQVTVQTPAPILGSTRRVAVFDETRNPIITTDAVALEFGRRALVALGRAPGGYQLVLPYDPRLELGDWIQVQPNGIHHTAPWSGAVTSISHAIAGTSVVPAGPTTTVTLRGAFGGGVTRWLSRITRTRLRQQIREELDSPPSPTPPPIQVGDVAIFYTEGEGPGFSRESSPEDSLGGYISTTRVGTGLGSIFRAVTAEEAQAGITLYAVLAVANTAERVPWPAVRGWVSQPSVEGVTVEIGSDPTGVVELESTDPQGVTIADAETAPTGVTFSAPELTHDGIIIGHLDPERGRVFHVRLVVAAGAEPQITDGSICFGTCFPRPPESSAEPSP